MSRAGIWPGGLRWIARRVKPSRRHPEEPDRLRDEDRLEVLHHGSMKPTWAHIGHAQNVRYRSGLQAGWLRSDFRHNGGYLRTGRGSAWSLNVIRYSERRDPAGF